MSGDPAPRTRWPRLALTAALGLLSAIAVAAVVGIPSKDAFELVGVSFGVAVACFATGSVALTRLGRRGSRGVGVRGVIVALIPVASLAAGALAAARLMFVSTHDLRALAVVVAGAGTAGVMAGLLLAHELDAARRLLDISHERQETLERSRRELVAWVSHDLRTPLAGIRAMAEALSDGVVEDHSTVVRYHESIQTEAERLARLVDDLFELSRLQIDGVTLAFERTSLGDIVSDALASAAPVADAKGVVLDGRVYGPAPLIDVSSPEMLRVVRNLLDNAIRHTPSGGRVTVEVAHSDGQAVVSVIDECGGIPEVDIGRVFDMAYRGDHARSPDTVGGGLGLTIARGLVEAHRGELGVHNEESGCRFSLRLPLPASAQRVGDEGGHPISEGSGCSEPEHDRRPLG